MDTELRVLAGSPERNRLQGNYRADSSLDIMLVLGHMPDM